MCFPNPSSIKCIQSGPAAKWTPRRLAPHHNPRNPLVVSWTKEKTKLNKNVTGQYQILTAHSRFSAVALSFQRLIATRIWRHGPCYLWSSNKFRKVRQDHSNCLGRPCNEKKWLIIVLELAGGVTSTNGTVFELWNYRKSNTAIALPDCHWQWHISLA